jgi:hypothetical protein
MITPWIRFSANICHGDYGEAIWEAFALAARVFYEKDVKNIAGG